MNKWVEIDVAAIENNIREIQAKLEARTRLIAVVKANAYGHGAVETTRLLNRLGVDFFAVSFIEEALQLRAAGVEADVLVFSPIIDKADARDAVANALTLTIASEGDRQLIENACTELGCSIKVHMKVDTGLGRFGLYGDQALSVWNRINSCELLEMEGIYTHIADPSSRRSAEKQFRWFTQLVGRLEQAGAVFPIKHMANSALFLRFPHMQLDAVRIGTLLSGQHPVGRDLPHLQLQDPYTFKSRVISVRDLPRGTRLGYYGTYRLKEDARIVVIPVGFHDGLALEVSNKPIDIWDMIKKLTKLVLGYCGWPGEQICVYIGDTRCPVRGKVFMQMALAEVPAGTEIRVGDEVVVPVRKTLASNDVSRVYLNQHRKSNDVRVDIGY